MPRWSCARNARLVGVMALALSAGVGGVALAATFPDADDDGDADGFDLGALEACWVSPAAEPAGAGGCAVFESTGDGAVTLADFAHFQDLYTGDGAVAGTFPSDWISGFANCGQNTDPPIQVHQFNEDTYILRQNKCINFEGPFMYLLLGWDRAILFDTGATSSAVTFPIQATVQGIVNEWKATHEVSPEFRLIVAHTHGHGDHAAGDGQFVGKPATQVVGTSAAAVQAFYGFTSWPDQVVQYELGGRTLDIFGIPGHQGAHIAVYDRRTNAIITGDHLYPGFLFISNFTQYKASCQRLANFADSHDISYVLGTHIEMTSTPGVAYPYGTTFQPNEHVLQLFPEHIDEQNDAVQAMGNTPVQEVHDDFIISP